MQSNSQKTPTWKNSGNFTQRHPLLFLLILMIVAAGMVIVLVATLAAIMPDRQGTTSFSLSKKKKVGLVVVRGAIMDSGETLRWIKTLRENDSIHGVLLRVDSPGGAVAPSQEIYNAVKRLVEVKPVVVSMGSAGASGGYYISAPASFILANPSTITGSIGVIMELTNLEELMKKLGISRQALTSGVLKGAGSPFKKLTEKEREYLQGIIMDIHEQFVSDVAEARGIPREELDLIADGRALTGNQALAVGLVDQLGDFEMALEELKGLCGLTGQDIQLITAPQEEGKWVENLLGSLKIHITTELPQAEMTFR